MANEDTRSSEQAYNSAERDKFEGSVKEVGGRIKESTSPQR